MATWTGRLLLLAALCVVIGATAFRTTPPILGYVVLGLCVVVSMLCLHVVSLEPADNLSFRGLRQAYVEQMVARVLGNIWLVKFRFTSKDVRSTQNKILMKILKNGAKTKHGKDKRLSAISSVSEYRERMPLTSYSDYEPYVERCVGGEDNVLFPGTIDYFGATSGTTSGKSKLFPMNLKGSKSDIMPPMLAGIASCLSAIPKSKKLKFHHGVWTPSRTSKTTKGVEKGSVSKKFLRPMWHSPTPTEGYLISDEEAAQYVQMLFALREPEVVSFFTITSSIVLKMLTLVENNWEKFVLDIRRGRINGDLDIPKDLRITLESKLVPDAKRANDLEAIFSSGCKHMLPRIWPHLAQISAMCHGTFTLQTKIVKERYAGPNVPIVGFFHISTEASYGISLTDGVLKKHGEYTILSNMNFYEFIPLEETDEKIPKALLAEQVEVGHVYELVVTSNRGLYRYRTGDVIKIVGFYGTTPSYEILHRVGDMLNVHVEKVPEKVLRDAIEGASRGWPPGRQLHQFAASENIHVDMVREKADDKLYYVVFLEMESDEPLLEAEKQSVDLELCRVSDTYRAFRIKGTISPAHVSQVKCGSFEKMRTLASDRNPLLYRFQYKHPRVVRDTSNLQLLLGNTI